MALALAYTATVNITRGFVMGLATIADQRAGYRKGVEAISNAYNIAVNRNFFYTGDISQLDALSVAARNRKLHNEAPTFHFIQNISAEDAWLKARGYLQHIEKGWGLSSFSAASFGK